MKFLIGAIISSYKRHFLGRWADGELDASRYTNLCNSLIFIEFIMHRLSMKSTGYELVYNEIS